MIDLQREIYKAVSKPDFTAHDIMESLSEFGLGGGGRTGGVRGMGGGKEIEGQWL
jgi:hypothetical protein